MIGLKFIRDAVVVRRECMQAQSVASSAHAVLQVVRQCGRAQVATVDGMVDLKIPAGTQPGTTLVMAKRGVPRLGSSTVRGDHQVRHCAAAARALSARAASARILSGKCSDSSYCGRCMCA